MKYVISTRHYTKRTLEEFLQAQADKVPDPSGAADLSGLAVKIRADSYVEFKHVQVVLLACMKANVWMVSFGVAPKPAEDKR